MLNEIKIILKTLNKNNVKIYFTGFFRANIPNFFKEFNIHTKTKFYSLNEIDALNYLINENFIHSIVNLSFYVFYDNIDTNNFNTKDSIANLYMENCFTECGLIFNKNIYKEAEILKNLN